MTKDTNTNRENSNNDQKYKSSDEGKKEKLNNNKVSENKIIFIASSTPRTRYNLSNSETRQSENIWKVERHLENPKKGS